MIAELGLAALWIAAALSLLQAIWGLGGLSRPMTEFTGAVRRVSVLQAALTLISFGALIYCFAISDFSVRLVATNSHVDKPLFYRIAATWGNHEGSMLLWVAVLAMAGAAVALFERRLDPRTLSATLGAQGLLAIGFFAFLLFSSNPFERLMPPAVVGQGLNPLLQDPGLAFHPPTLYFGYVGLSVAFSFAVGALLTKRVDADFARAMRPWVLAAWIFLTIGIVAGSYWAYYELGWGGWWFWDPVENASLMPWIAATALLHSVSVLAARDALRSWTVMLALIGFAMSMVGTFLVRSGILTSVHAFAVDPERGSFILALLAIYVGAAFALFALRIGAVRQGEGFHLFSREAGLVVNNLLLSVILAIVFIGTLYPLFAELSFGAKLSVGPPYFNKASVPVALLLIIMLMVGPLLSWRRETRGGVSKKLIAPVLAMAAVAIGLVVSGANIGWMPFAGLVFAGGLAVASLMPLAGRNLRRTPIAIYGMVLAHFGIAVSVVGMASEAGFSRELLVAMQPGDEAQLGDWRVTLDGVEPVLGPNWTAVQADLTVSHAGDSWAMVPQSRHFPMAGRETSEAALKTRAAGQFYAVIGARDGDRWQMRFWWKPLVTLIWIGGLLVAAGGALALVGRLLGGWRARRRTDADFGDESEAAA